MAIKRIVIGSKNVGKVEEWSRYFNEFGIETKSLSDFGEVKVPEETGSTFTDNARIKASGYAKQIHEYVFADDGGYEIDFLGGWPSVKSRRILPGEEEGTDQELIDIVLEKMKGVLKEKRTVKLTSAAALSDPDGKIIFEDIAHSPGFITKKPGPVLIPGYPFRTIHFLPDLGKTYAELTPEELKAHSHKRPVAKKLAEFLLKYNHA
jgi:XTP/dITP diphosphohydrolase